MKKWYSFYAFSDGFKAVVRTLGEQIDTSSKKLQQVAAGISETDSEEKLQQAVAEFPFPAVFSYVPWGHHI